MFRKVPYVKCHDWKQDDFIGTNGGKKMLFKEKDALNFNSRGLDLRAHIMDIITILIMCGSTL